jgi:mono/diheme cytochrome c family protein
MLPGPMPSYAETLTPEQRWDVVAYVLASARPPPGEPGSRLAGPGQHPDPAVRGEYLVGAAMCGLCHTQIDRTGIYREAAFLAGGMRVSAYPHGVFVSRNLTPDAETGTGPLTPEQIARVVREGRRPDRVLNPWAMPWWVLHQLTPEDATAIGTHLGRMAPVRNRIPPPLEYGYVETFVAKLATPLPAAMPVALSYADGNFGSAAASGPRRGELGRILLHAERLAAAVAAAAWLVSRWRRPGPRRPLRRALAAAALALVALGAWIVVGLPHRLPPEPLAKAVSGGIPEPPRAETGERAALLARGRYLFGVSSCSFCHGPDGGGGSKVSWSAFGTLWARNVTSDPEAGVGAWSDAELARAIRSGIARGGRTLHWQGMTWDLLSNLDEEDVRALVGYLRTLPPVRNAIPDPRPPAADDCAVYTFFLRGDRLREPGCG